MVFFSSFRGHPLAARGARSLPLGGHIPKYHWQNGIKPQNVHNFHQNHYKVPHLKFLTPVATWHLDWYLATWHLDRCQVARF